MTGSTFSATTAEKIKTIKSLVQAGELGLDDVNRAFDELIAGKSAPVGVVQPSWYVQPDEQLEDAGRIITDQKWGFTPLDFPAAIAFTPSTPTELQVLAMTLPGEGRVNSTLCTFMAHIQVITNQLRSQGLQFKSWDNLDTALAHLRLFARREPKPGLRWVGYDPVVDYEVRCKYCMIDTWNSGRNTTSRLAAPEVLSALMTFPEYGMDMNGDEKPYANMAGYQFNKGLNCSDGPYLRIGSGTDGLNLHAAWSDTPVMGWATPKIREL